MYVCTNFKSHKLTFYKNIGIFALLKVKSSICCFVTFVITAFWLIYLWQENMQATMMHINLWNGYYKQSSSCKLSSDMIYTHHRKTQMSHLTHLSHSGSLHGQKDSFFTHFWVTLSVYWPTTAQMSQMTHLGFSVVHVHTEVAATTTQPINKKGLSGFPQMRLQALIACVLMDRPC